jgi:hypothetical protein
VVGDDADLEQMRAENSWSSQYNVEWHHYFGTADFRYLLPAPAGGLVVLMMLIRSSYVRSFGIWNGCFAMIHASLVIWRIHLLR